MGPLAEPDCWPAKSSPQLRPGSRRRCRARRAKRSTLWRRSTPRPNCPAGPPARGSCWLLGAWSGTEAGAARSSANLRMAPKVQREPPSILPAASRLVWEALAQRDPPRPRRTTSWGEKSAPFCCCCCCCCSNPDPDRGAREPLADAAGAREAVAAAAVAVEGGEQGSLRFAAGIVWNSSLLGHFEFGEWCLLVSGRQSHWCEFEHPLRAGLGFAFAGTARPTPARRQAARASSSAAPSAVGAVAELAGTRLAVTTPVPGGAAAAAERLGVGLHWHFCQHSSVVPARGPMPGAGEPRHNPRNEGHVPSD
mmetsp:Transcript_30824/g.66342  ORF Transcript_30824/g.66342 Transcript_30824/m.66342 type:complete len:309 (+) Transcript_30824:221-1147(+)